MAAPHSNANANSFTNPHWHADFFTDQHEHANCFADGL
jgi:hypothetical protein